MLALTSSWTLDWDCYTIRVNGLAPGPTPLKAAANDMAVGRPGVPPSFEKHRGRIPQGCLGPQDCASAALFLCSDAASYITGVNLAAGGDISLPTMTTEIVDPTMGGCSASLRPADPCLCRRHNESLLHERI
ncbi:SDR family oxidoreductase [Streptomyces albidoflavus]